MASNPIWKEKKKKKNFLLQNRFGRPFRYRKNGRGTTILK